MPTEDSLNKEQIQVLSHDDLSLLIIAGAGTGKTKTIIEKIYSLLTTGTKKEQILAMTFTNKAAREMQERLHQKGVVPPFIGTFHSFCVRTLREYGNLIDIPKNFTIVDRADGKKIIKRILKNRGETDVRPSVIQSLLAKEKMGVEYEHPTSIQKLARDLANEYERALQREQSLDFEDLLVKAVQLLESSKEVRETLQGRYRCVLVDEFQDTDATQNKLIQLMKGKETKIIAVGDADQTIYSWRGANIEHMLSFVETYAPAKTIILNRNYRSTENILAAANAVIEKNVLRQKKDLVTHRGAGEPITYIQAEDEDDEALLLIEEIETLHESEVKYADISILYRVNFQSRALETALVKANIPYQVAGTRFFEKPEVKDILSYIKVLKNPSSVEAFERAAQSPRRGIGDATLEKVRSGNEGSLSAGAGAKLASFKKQLAIFEKHLSKHSVAETIEFIIYETNYHTHAEKRFESPEERMETLHELVSFAKRFDTLTGHEGADTLLEETALVSDQDGVQDTDGVHLMTIHAAKGLEFPYVFISGMEDGLFPYTRIDDERDEEEERRLCYVAITRAKERLWCSFASRRSFFGTTTKNSPSPFLIDMGCFDLEEINW